MSEGPDPLGLSRGAWVRHVAQAGHASYRGRQVFDALHRRGLRSYERMRELPADLRLRLAGEVPIRLPEIARRDAAQDGSVKYGLRLSDGALIESVFMPGDPAAALVNEFEDARVFPSPVPSGPWNSPARPRRMPTRQSFTVCLSSQTGCAVDCAFCITGRLGGGRNLTAGEIVGQLYAVLDDAGASLEGLRVVFMGMGEPFLNPEGVLGALDVLFELLAPRRVTVSTSGITPVLQRFALLPKRPNLAVSINAADEETRSRLMPINRTYPLGGLVQAMQAWPADSRRPITAEYVLIAGANDTLGDARRLARLLQGLAVKINVIPLNEDPVYLPGLSRPPEQTIDAFVRTLAASGARVTVRRSKGPDARAACGQLKGRTEDPRRGRSRRDHVEGPAVSGGRPV